MLLGSKPAFSWRGSCFGSLPGLWSPERSPPPHSQRGTGLILLSEGRGLLSLLTLEDPSLWVNFAASPSPFQKFQFLVGETLVWVRDLPVSILQECLKSGFSLELERWGIEILMSHGDIGTKHLLGACTMPGSVLIFAHWVFEA